jgi:hypothetical protein
MNLKDRKDFFGTIIKIDESTMRDEILKPIKTTRKDVMKPEDKLKKFIENMRLPTIFNDATEKEKTDWKNRQLKSLALAITYTFQGTEDLIEKREWFKVPTSRGYEKSNLKSIILINNLPDETNEWINKPIKLTTTSEGYVEILK